MGWLRLVGSLKVQVSIAKEPYKRDCILQKKTCNLKEPTNRSHPISCVIGWASGWVGEERERGKICVYLSRKICAHHLNEEEKARPKRAGTHMHSSSLFLSLS